MKYTVVGYAACRGTIPRRKKKFASILCIPERFFDVIYSKELCELEKCKEKFYDYYGETVESAVANALDAKKAWLEAAIEDGIEIHEPDSLEEYSGQFKLRIPRSLHRSLAEHSKREGISMNQYCVYLLSKNDAVYSK